MYDREMRQTGLEPTQYSLLMALRIKGETSQGDLGTLLALDSTTLSRMFRPLIKHGWIAERPGKDRRVRLLALTAMGSLKLDQCRIQWERAQEKLRSRLGEPVWSNLGALLTQVTHASMGE